MSLMSASFHSFTSALACVMQNMVLVVIKLEKVVKEE